MVREGPRRSSDVGVEVGVYVVESSCGRGVFPATGDLELVAQEALREVVQKRNFMGHGLTLELVGGGAG